MQYAQQACHLQVLPPHATKLTHARQWLLLRDQGQLRDISVDNFASLSLMLAHALHCAQWARTSSQSYSQDQLHSFSATNLEHDHKRPIPDSPLLNTFQSSSPSL